MIIINNFNEMENGVQANFNESLISIDEITFSACLSFEKTESIVNKTKNDFEDLVVEDTLDD